MASYSVAQAKDRLSALVHAAERGEPVEITRYGRGVAVIVPMASAPGRTSSQLEALEDIWRKVDKLNLPKLDWAAEIRKTRDEDWG